MTSHNVINMAEPQNSRFSVKHRPKLKISPKKKLQISEYHRVFDMKEGNDISNIHRKFQDQTSNKIFKMVILNFLRW